MDDVRIGQALRTIRVRKRLRQTDVAQLAGVRRDEVIALERGRCGGLAWHKVKAVATALGASIGMELRWQGADLDRLLSEGHAALHGFVGRHLLGLPGWESVPEVSFSIYGERGVIDILCWHAPTRSLLIIELKTALGDAQALVGTMDRRVRLGKAIAAERGWQPLTVSAWVVFTDSRTNRRHVRANATLLGTRFPADGHAIRSWLRAPSGTIAALSFWSDVGDGDRTRTAGRPRRVRPTRAERAGRGTVGGHASSVGLVRP